ncbi:cold shock protein (beta-ribbon, CspA family) [Marinobacter sp. LV10R510-11A]|uniref:cold shock domain-containing protein n=1 Tax=Marinobacter sp. LV10R510-11A TaxID=1415568 RepID=UPI000BB6E405|nr:cold shock domain-containing protein [Marinobacter sp. LV10R510-11A]SOB75054.1 cold shock protein (beta-ribbon, CspA family) [Marinobacter sp. LV10R510-11A]
MPRGKVKWFNNAKGYGFIIEEGCTDDLFAHFSSVHMDGYKTLKAGQPVNFDKKPSEKGVHAVNIVPEEQAGGQAETQAGASDTSEKTTETTEADRGDYPPRAVNA